MVEFDKPDKIFASYLYPVYKRMHFAGVCTSDKDRPLIFYLLHKTCIEKNPGA